MLFEEGLSNSWLEIVLGTAQRVSNYVRPDVREEGDDMNILKYVKFKKVSKYVRPDIREEGDDMNIFKYVKFKKVSNYVRPEKVVNNVRVCGVYRHFQQYCSYIVAVSFICGGNWST